MDRRLILIFPFFLWFALLILAPFSLILATSFAHRDVLGNVEFAFQLDAYKELLQPVYFSVLTRSLVLAAVNTMVTSILAFPLAFFLSRLPKNTAGVYLVLILIPFWTNFLIRLLAFMDVLRLQPFGISWTYTWHGIVAAMVYNYLPIAVLPLYSAMEKIPNSVLEAAWDLGASKRRVFTRVLFPMTKRAVYSTGVLLFIPSLGEFLIPELVGGGKRYFLGAFLEQQFLTVRNWPLGSATIVLVLALSLLLLKLFGSPLLEDK